MQTPLPTNERLLAYSDAVPWQLIEESKRKFNAALKDLAAKGHDGPLPLDLLGEIVGLPLSTYYAADDSAQANIVLAQQNAHRFVLGSAVSARYRSGKTLAQSLTPYNLNPSVNHSNIAETDSPATKMRALGAEIELGLLYPDGSEPDEDKMQVFIRSYEMNARRLGITPQIDREASQCQVEAHVAPGIGYLRTRHSLDGILASVAASSEATGLHTAILSAYPVYSNFTLTQNAKVNTAVDLMVGLNAEFPHNKGLLDAAKARYGISPDSNVVQVFRLQGTHIHLDLAARSEALGLLAFYTMLRSTTAIANGAFLKGGPFVNGVCDAELLCTREYLRRTTVTGRMLEIPLTPHLSDHGLDAYADLLHSERVNAMARGLLCESGLGSRIAAMHNPIGRLRPDLGSTKRICTLESTGMPVNISASRQAAVLTDFEFTHALIENYFRAHGTDLAPMMADRELWEIIGPLTSAEFAAQQDESDRQCTDMTLRTALGTEMPLVEFYEKKRIYMHRHLFDIAGIMPRDIDEVYMSFQRMLVPPSGQSAETIEQYIVDPKLRSTGNWGRILRNAYEEEGGVVGQADHTAVLRVTNRVHRALIERYQQI